MPGMVIAAAFLALVLAAAYWHDRRNRDRAGSHDMEGAARKARGETDRHIGMHFSPPAGPPPPPGPSL